MHESQLVKGNMISIKINQHDPLLEQLVTQSGASIACINSPSQVVLSGSTRLIGKACLICKEKQIPFSILKVENAFHSSLMKEVEPSLMSYLSGIEFSEPVRNIFSTV